MNGTYPITELTTDYNYAIQKQEVLSLMRRSVLHSHSFTRSSTSILISATAPELEKKKEENKQEHKDEPIRERAGS